MRRVITNGRTIGIPNCDKEIVPDKLRYMLACEQGLRTQREIKKLLNHKMVFVDVRRN